MPKISVVISTFNRAELLYQAIQSVLNQTFPDFELIIVDDGSLDNTAGVVRQLNDPRIVYIRQENAGRSIARNRGMEYAQGEYIALLDDDDLYLPNKLARQVKYLEENPEVILVACEIQFIDESGRRINKFSTRPSFPELTLDKCLYSCPLIPSNVMFKRRVLKSLDHWFDPELSPVEDKDIFIRMLMIGSKLVWLPDVLSSYRVHTNNSQGDGEKTSLANRKLLDKLFTDPDLPKSIKEKRDDFYAHHSLVGACHAYATGQVKFAQQELMRAIGHSPELMLGTPPKVIFQIASFANSFRVSDPAMYIDFVFKNLPTSLDQLRHYHSEARGIIHVSRVFNSNRAGEQPSFLDWMIGIWFAPRWARNFGMWSILLRDIFGILPPKRKFPK